MIFDDTAGTALIAPTSCGGSQTLLSPKKSLNLVVAYHNGLDAVVLTLDLRIIGDSGLGVYGLPNPIKPLHANDEGLKDMVSATPGVLNDGGKRTDGFWASPVTTLWSAMPHLLPQPGRRELLSRSLLLQIPYHRIPLVSR